MSPVSSTKESQPVHEATRVLVVEDNVDDRDLLIRQLRKSNIAEHVKFLEDGESALHFVSNLPPSNPFADLIAIFLDLRLPSMNGLEFLRALREIPRVRETPVIVMTSSLDPQDFAECQRLKVSSFIAKPITFESFSKAITKLSHRSK